MKNFNYKNPTEIIFGEGQIKDIGKLLKPHVNKVLLTYGKESIKKNGIYDIVVDSLRSNDIEFVEYSGIRANPVLSHSQKGVDFARQQGVDAILAVGGGSVIDESKAIALGTLYEGDLWDFFSGKSTPQKALKLFTILTVPATGSEMNGGMVLTNEETQDKFGFSCPLTYPVLSVLDPSVTLSLPTKYVACAAVDIFAHSTEAYFTKDDQNSFIIDRAVEGVLKSLIEATDKIMKNPQDIDARANFMWTATLAWNGSLHCGVGVWGMPNHIIEHPLSAVYDIAHGAGLAIIIPAWMKVFEEKYQQRFALFARNVFGVDEIDDKIAAQKGRSALVDWFQKLGVAVTFAEAGIENIDIERLSSLAMSVMSSKGGSFMSQEEIKKVLEVAKK